MLGREVGALEMGALGGKRAVVDGSKPSVRPPLPARATLYFNASCLVVITVLQLSAKLCLDWNSKSENSVGVKPYVMSSCFNICSQRQAEEQTALFFTSCKALHSYNAGPHRIWFPCILNQFWIWTVWNDCKHSTQRKHSGKRFAVLPFDKQ